MENLIKGTMASYNEYLDEVVNGCGVISNNLRQGNTNDAITQIVNFTDGLNWISQINKKMTSLGYENDLNLEDLKEFLEEINSGIINEDYNLVADIFEFELVPYFQSSSRYNIQ